MAFNKLSEQFVSFWCKTFSEMFWNMKNLIEGFVKKDKVTRINFNESIRLSIVICNLFDCPFFGGKKLIPKFQSMEGCEVQCDTPPLRLRMLRWRLRVGGDRLRLGLASECLKSGKRCNFRTFFWIKFFLNVLFLVY